VRLLVSHEDLCHMDLVTDVKYGKQGVSSWMILRHQGRGSVCEANHTHTYTHTHTHTHTHSRSHAHTQRAVHLKVDHTMTKERFLPITTACCSCLPLLAAITSLFRPTSLVSYATRKSLFLIRLRRTLAKYLVDIAWACVVEGPFTPLLNVTEHILTVHTNECSSFAL